MSVDAATKKTYETIRLNGKWEDAIAAMQFIRDLKKAGVVKKIQFNFCVQWLNYKELPAFCELAFAHGADCVHAAALIKLPHQTDVWFKQHSVTNPNHPEFSEYQKMKTGPILKAIERLHGKILMPTLDQDYESLPLAKLYI